MKKIVIVIAAVLAALIIISFVKDVIIKVSVEKGVEIVTGLKLKMSSLRVGILKQLVEIKHLVLLNPRGFKDRIMFDMPELYVDCDLMSCAKGKIHVNNMILNMKEFNVIKDAQGRLNLDSLNVVKAQKESKSPEKSSKAKTPDIQIDNLELKLGKVVYKDYSKAEGEKPYVKEYVLNVSEKYQNISNPYALVSLIMVKSLTNTAIASFVNLDLGALQNTLSGTVTNAQKIVTNAVTQTGAVVKQTTEKTADVIVKTQEATKEAVKETEDTLKKTADSLKEAIKLPLGAAEKE
ncbi:MAG: hypothetical protein JW994_06350 [Candidatus Omnitrophica bacterium]|nr:hypothetical protein [Candidatus Omnitrophota bacterium]